MTNLSKTALVTGASSGIGLDVARGFLSLGYNVVLNSRDQTKLEKAAATLGGADKIALVVGDIGVPETGEKMIDVAVSLFGGVNVLVNNAGIFGLKPFLDNKEQDLDSYISTNLKGTYFVTQAVVRQMVAQGEQEGGSIVNIGTVLIDHPSATLPASAALITKGGVHALTRSLASELAVHNIRVNAVAPGVIRTGIYGDADIDALGKSALLKRVGEVDEITQAVAYLSTSKFTTGVIIPVDGGYTNGRA